MWSSPSQPTSRPIDEALTYKFMRNVVGGDVQLVPIGPDIQIVCNENGMFAAGGGPLPANDAGYLGDVLIYANGADDNDMNARDMTDEELRKGLAFFERGKGVKHGVFTGQTSSGIIFGQKKIDKFLKEKAENTLGFWESL